MKLRFVTSLFLLNLSVLSYGQHFCHFSPPLLTNTTNETDLRGDTVDVISYEINLDMRKDEDKFISGFTTLKYVTQIQTNQFRFDFEGLTIDSVDLGKNQTRIKNNVINHSTFFEIKTENNIAKGDTLSLTVYYQGNPKKDGSWGGFYYSGSYSYNMGIAFTSKPHNYGRIWFPCIDNFTDKAQFSFNIITDPEDVAMCNGNLINSGDWDQNGNRFYNWKLDQPIPTYLASIAVAPYEVLTHSYRGLPVTLAALAKDTTKLKASFINLNTCISTFIDHYGPHPFERIGFNIVPFNGGAMEHATNIAYPYFAISGGNLDYETLYAHEFAHHWWGDYITCSTPEDMWLNEGWASYSERLFLEKTYNKDRYKESIALNHKAILHYAHLRDGSSLPVSGISHNNTYGMHVYDKGADVAHTLRGYMGDEAFFKAIKSLMEKYQFSTLSSADMRDHFQTHTQSDLTSFFDQWVFEKGFPMFYIFSQTQEGKHLTLRIKQDLKFAPKPFTNVPYEVTLFDSEGNSELKNITVSGRDGEYLLNTDLDVVYAVLDYEQKISDAITEHTTFANADDDVDFENALLNIKFGDVSSNTMLRVEHRWVSPDHYYQEIPGLTMSKERYWDINGLFNETLPGEITFQYNGLESGNSYADGYLDNGLITNSEDSLVLLYRPNAWSKWEIHPNYTLNVIISTTNKIGNMVAHDIRKGQYAFAIYDHTKILSAANIETAKVEMQISPNPTDSSIRIKLSHHAGGTVELFKSNGQVLKQIDLRKNKTSINIDIKNYPTGIYYVSFQEYGKKAVVKRLLVR